MTSADSQASATIDLGALAHNVQVLREHAGDTAVMAVVKADGYGHGAVQVAQTVLTAGARELGVTTLTEALQLRAAGITAPILSWLHTPDADFAAAIGADVEIGISSMPTLAAVVEAAQQAGRRAAVTVKVDTGLNRNGVTADEWPALRTALTVAEREGTVRVRGMFTHFAHADEPNHPFIDVQARRFREAVDSARSAGLDIEVTHAANSAATLTRPDLRFDMVRPGIALYGLSPMPELGDFGLRPVMTLTARVVKVKKVAAGEGVSYGHTWTAPRDTTVCVLPVGYADGVFRSLSNRFEVLVGGRRCPSVGRVCMDQLVVDLGPDADVREGDTAVLFGDGATGAPVAQDWASTLDTIHYEIVTAVRGRVQRRYLPWQPGVTVEVDRAGVA
ncbi:alanine racemase [Rhodococcus sp. D2-41]|uniref:Alanine racemase n=1 Tax=Speluncibacter jeojiensis TaxID=2710754 RepID=A0A9X4M281_9ACTN|nr:alanine racemase [Rhodococcus sp. D2-41]MDG3008983.1 alanine racemase [Rhodococcus sp. D2-41]MDG3015494.1 alanine racemase [Corynebacteriales bacterium D3-21]